MGRIKDEIQDKSWQEAQVSAWILAEMANVNQYQKPDAEFQRAGAEDVRAVRRTREDSEPPRSEGRDRPAAVRRPDLQELSREVSEE